jgi:predicted aminopeptidase
MSSRGAAVQPAAALVLALIAGLLPAVLSGCQTGVGYLVKQGGYLISYNTGARDIQALLRDPALPAGDRQLLLRVQDIKGYAVERIGLARNGNYTRYKELPGDHVADVVQACDAVSFTPYLWSYPILGRLPYKGFYERADAEMEADRLRAQGFDVIIRPVDSFSTLGLLKDPVYSFMRGYSFFALASLIIHEQTHATVFIKGQPQFNEELATFVGDVGAFSYLRERLGGESREYREAQDSQADSALFVASLRELRTELESVYSASLTREEKLSRKAEVIEAFQKRFLSEVSPRFRTGGYRSARRLPLNNAYLSLYGLYTDNLALLERFYTQACGADLRLFVSRVKDMSGSPGDMTTRLRVRQGP